jgi:hypothetical protein
LGDADKQQLLNWISKDRKVSITFQGTESDAGPLAQEIYDFLQSSGYTMTGPPQGAMIITPSGAPQGVQVNLDKDHPQNPVGIVVGIRKN